MNLIMRLGQVPVFWILAAICLLLALTVPRLRLGGIVGCVILGLMLGWGMIQRLNAPDRSDTTVRGSPVSPARIVVAFPLESIGAAEFRLTGGGAPFQLRGHLKNESPDQQLKSITVQMTRRDCFEGALDPSGCAVIWQDRQWIEMAVPPQADREFVHSVWMHGSAPRIRGTIKDEFQIVAATGEPVSKVER